MIQNPTSSFEDIFPRGRRGSHVRIAADDANHLSPPVKMIRESRSALFRLFCRHGNGRGRGFLRRTDGMEDGVAIKSAISLDESLRFLSRESTHVCPPLPLSPDLGASSDFLTFLWGRAHFLRMNRARRRELSWLIKVEFRKWRFSSLFENIL